MNQNQLVELKQYLESAEIALNQAKEIIDLMGGNEKNLNKIAKKRARTLTSVSEDENAKTVEGVFNGQHMIAADGKEYSIPANYASKSKLVAGDQMKLTIQPDGSFIYKQTKPIEQERLTGTIVTTEDGYAVITDDSRKFNVLTASITYFKGQPGDTAVILIPINYPSLWAAVENVIKNIKTGKEDLATQPLLENNHEELLPPVKTDLLATEEPKELPENQSEHNPSTITNPHSDDLDLATDDMEDL